MSRLRAIWREKEAVLNLMRKESDATGILHKLIHGDPVLDAMTDRRKAKDAYFETLDEAFLDLENAVAQYERSRELEEDPGLTQEETLAMVGSFDASLWARMFAKAFRRVPGEEVLTGWFANAMMAGHDFQARKDEEESARISKRVAFLERVAEQAEEWGALCVDEAGNVLFFGGSAGESDAPELVAYLKGKEAQATPSSIKEGEA